MSSNESIDNKSNGGGVPHDSPSEDPPRPNAEALLAALRTIKENEGATMVGTGALNGILAEYVDMKSLIHSDTHMKRKLDICAEIRAVKKLKADATCLEDDFAPNFFPEGKQNYVDNLDEKINSLEQQLKEIPSSKKETSTQTQNSEDPSGIVANDPARRSSTGLVANEGGLVAFLDFTIRQKDAHINQLETRILEGYEEIRRIADRMIANLDNGEDRENGEDLDNGDLDNGN